MCARSHYTSVFMAEVIHDTAFRNIMGEEQSWSARDWGRYSNPSCALEWELMAEMNQSLLT